MSFFPATFLKTGNVSHTDITGYETELHPDKSPGRIEVASLKMVEGIMVRNQSTLVVFD